MTDRPTPEQIAEIRERSLLPPAQWDARKCFDDRDALLRELDARDAERAWRPGWHDLTPEQRLNITEAIAVPGWTWPMRAQAACEVIRRLERSSPRPKGQAMSDLAKREQFEEWLLGDGWHGDEHLRKTPSGNYDSPSVGVAWRAWQAAAALSPPLPAVGNRTVADLRHAFRAASGWTYVAVPRGVVNDAIAMLSVSSPPPAVGSLAALRDRLGNTIGFVPTATVGSTVSASPAPSPVRDAVVEALKKISVAKQSGRMGNVEPVDAFIVRIKQIANDALAALKDTAT